MYILSTEYLHVNNCKICRCKQLSSHSQDSSKGTLWELFTFSFYLASTLKTFNISHLFKKTAYNAGDAGEEETSREQGLPPYDVHHQQDQDVRRDLCESFSFERQMWQDIKQLTYDTADDEVCEDVIAEVGHAKGYPVIAHSHCHNYLCHSKKGNG